MNRLCAREALVAKALASLVGNDTSLPVALICASGARSSYTETLLEHAGFNAVYSVCEGMLGGRAGPGWLKRVLPTVAAN